MADRCFANLKAALHHPAVKGKRTTEALTLQKTLLWAVAAPTAGPAGASPNTVNRVRSEVLETARALSLNQSKGFVKRMQDATVVKRDNFSGDCKPQLIDQYRRSKYGRYTEEFCNKCIFWVMNCSNLVQDSPNAKDQVTVKDKFTGVKTLEQKKYYYFSIREIHNEMIKPVDQGGMDGALDAEGNVLVSDTALRAMLPKSLRPMTDSQKAMCGCDTCLNARSYITALNSFRRRLRKHLQGCRNKHAIDSGPHKVLSKAVQDYEDYAFPNDGPSVWPKCSSAMYTMTCAAVGDTTMVPLKCCLGRCSACPAAVQTRAEKATGLNCDPSRIIPWSEFEYTTKCTFHGVIPEKECARCKELDEDKRPKKAPTTNLEYVAKRAPIGTFMTEVFFVFLLAYRYHHFLLKILGKDHCLKSRREHYHKTPGGGNAYGHRDYSDRLASDFDQEAQSQGMGDKPNTGMEGITVCYYKEGIEIMDWFVYLSDLKQQDARTSHVNTRRLFKKLQAEPFNLLPRNQDAVFYEQCDGCTKQYKSGTALWSMIFLAHEFGISIDRMITAAGHGKGTVDALAGFDKGFIRKCFRAVKYIWEDIDKTSYGTASYSVDENGKSVSFAMRCRDLLDNEERVFGVKSTGPKSQEREKNRKTRQKFYDCVSYPPYGDEVVPLAKTCYKVCSGFDSPTYQDAKGNTKHYGKNGIKEHFHFYCHYRMKPLTCATRRIPCSCDSCHKQITKPWDPTIKDDAKQPRFANPPNCTLKDVLSGMNQWKILTIRVDPKKNVQEEIDECYEDALDGLEAFYLDKVKKGNIGGISAEDKQTAPDGYYIVKWMGEPEILQQPAKVEGYNAGLMPAGTLVCKGQYYNRVPRNPRWYQIGDRGYAEKTHYFRLQNVLEAEIELERYHKRNGPVPAGNNLTPQQLKMAPARCYRVPIEAEQKMMTEKARRAALDVVECEYQAHQSDDDDEDENMDDKSDEQDYDAMD